MTIPWRISHGLEPGGHAFHATLNKSASAPASRRNSRRSAADWTINSGLLRPPVPQAVDEDVRPRLSALSEVVARGASEFFDERLLVAFVIGVEGDRRHDHQNALLAVVSAPGRPDFGGPGEGM